jgi:hypothetical protein
MNVKHFKLLNLIAALAMLLGLIPVSAVAAPIEGPEPRAPQAPLADQTLTGSAVEGNLKVTVKDTGTMGVWRYVSSAWQRQIYGEYAKGSRLYYDGSAYSLSKESTWVMTGSDPTLVSNSTNGNTITTVWTMGASFRVTQTTTYNDGNAYYYLEWNITNTSGASIADLRFFHGEDTYLQGGDAAAGWWDADYNMIGAQKTIASNIQRMYLQGITDPYGYDSIHYGTARTNANAGALSNTVNPSASTDNGYALEWRQRSLAAGATWDIIAYEKFVTIPSGSVSVLAPISTDCVVGTACDVVYSVSNPGGAGVEVTLAVSGTQPTWNPTITSPASPTTVPAGGSTDVTVRVTVPAGTAHGTTGDFTLTATPTGGGTAAADTGAVQAIVPAPGTLSVIKAGGGTGQVTSDPSGISCGVDCLESFTLGQVVTLTATADPGSTFMGWSGDASGATSPVTVTMDASKVVTATFDIVPPQYADLAVTEDVLRCPAPSRQRSAASRGRAWVPAAQPAAAVEHCICCSTTR